MATKPRHLKTAIQLWVGDQRKAGGYTSKDLADWTGVTVDTARGWESRGRPSEDAIAILERKFGKQAPRGEAGAVPGDQAAIVEAIDRNTRMLSAVLEAIIARLPALPPEVAALLVEAEAQREQGQSGSSSPLPRSDPEPSAAPATGSRTGAPGIG